MESVGRLLGRVQEGGSEPGDADDLPPDLRGLVFTEERPDHEGAGKCARLDSARLGKGQSPCCWIFTD